MKRRSNAIIIIMIITACLVCYYIFTIANDEVYIICENNHEDLEYTNDICDDLKIVLDGLDVIDILYFNDPFERGLQNSIVVIQLSARDENSIKCFLDSNNVDLIYDNINKMPSLLKWSLISCHIDIESVKCYTLIFRNREGTDNYGYFETTQVIHVAFFEDASDYEFNVFITAGVPYLLGQHRTEK